MEEPLLECRFMIPVVRNSDRKPHSPLAWRVLQDAIRREYPKGHTGPENFYHASSLVPGEYEEEATGHTVKDLSRQYTIALSESQLEELRNLLGKAAITFDQEAIYLSVSGKVEFIKPETEEGLIEEYGGREPI